MGFFDQLLPDYSDPNSMAAWGAIGNMLLRGGTPIPGKGLGAGNALAMLAGSGMQGATAGANFAQEYQKQNIGNQMGGLNLQRAQAIQPAILKQINGMSSGAPGALNGGMSDSDQLALQTLQWAMMSGNPEQISKAYQTIYEHNPNLAGQIENAKARGGIAQTPNGPVPGYQVPGINNSPFGAMSPPVSDAPMQGTQPSISPVQGPQTIPPINASELQPPPQQQLRDASFMPPNPPPQSTSSVASNGADPTGMPKYKFNPFNKVETEQASKFGEADTKVNDAMTGQLDTYAQSEQRLNTIAQALKEVQSGGLTSTKAAIANMLQGLGVDPKTYNLDDPKSAYNVLHEQGINTLQELKQLTSGTGSRITNAEFTRIGNYMNNPDIPASTNLQLLGEAIGAIHYDKDMIDGWNNIGGLVNRAASGYTVRPDDYMRQWQLKHKMGDYVDQAKEKIGPLKGMEAQGNASPQVTYVRVNGKLVKQ